jgi:DNA mismatch repair ATPase MutS
MAVVVREFFDLTKKYHEEYGEKMILLMQVGSFMECYAKFDKKTQTFFGSNITVFSQMCELAIATKNTEIDNYPVYMAGFKDNYIEKYVKKIQDAGYTCVIYMQDEARPGSTRSLAGIFSPGTFFIDDTSKLTNNITCVWIEMIENKILLKIKLKNRMVAKYVK